MSGYELVLLVTLLLLAKFMGDGGGGVEGRRSDQFGEGAALVGLVLVVSSLAPFR